MHLRALMNFSHLSLSLGQVFRLSSLERLWGLVLTITLKFPKEPIFFEFSAVKSLYSLYLTQTTFYLKNSLTHTLEIVGKIQAWLHRAVIPAFRRRKEKRANSLSETSLGYIKTVSRNHKPEAN